MSISPAGNASPMFQIATALQTKATAARRDVADAGGNRHVAAENTVTNSRGNEQATRIGAFGDAQGNRQVVVTRSVTDAEGNSQTIGVRATVDADGNRAVSSAYRVTDAEGNSSTMLQGAAAAKDGALSTVAAQRSIDAAGNTYDRLARLETEPSATLPQRPEPADSRLNPNLVAAETPEARAIDVVA